MAKISLPYIAWRDGRPRFKPSARERLLGFIDLDLRHTEKTGQPWFTIDEARAWSDAKVAEIKATRASGTRPVKSKPAPASRTLDDLLEAWLESDQVKALAGKTIITYRKAVKAILYKPHPKDDQREEFPRMSVDSIEPPELCAFFNYHKKVRGHHAARQSIAVISAAWTWGRTSTFWRLGPNPRLGLELENPRPRVVVYTDVELRALIAAADAMGRPSVGDAIMLGVYTGQRQNDRLAMKDGGLVGGRRRFIQNKTGAIVEIPETPSLKARLEAARQRTAAHALQRAIRAEDRASTVVVDETFGRQYNENTYRHAFIAVRALAVTGSNELGLPPCPTLADKRDQDLRDTAVTWLARAGANLPMIASITGHSLRSIHNILAHYLAITPELADDAIAKLVAWMEREGMAV